MPCVAAGLLFRRRRDWNGGGRAVANAEAREDRIAGGNAGFLFATARVCMYECQIRHIGRLSVSGWRVVCAYSERRAAGGDTDIVARVSTFVSIEVRHT